MQAVKSPWWLALIAAAIVVLIMSLTAHFARAHDHNYPENNDWLKSLHSQNKTWCCNELDVESPDDWETRGGRYRVKSNGVWFDVPNDAIVDGPNRSGGPLVWFNKGYGGISVRCFMPGMMG